MVLFILKITWAVKEIDIFIISNFLLRFFTPCYSKNSTSVIDVGNNAIQLDKVIVSGITEVSVGLNNIRKIYSNLI